MQHLEKNMAHIKCTLLWFYNKSSGLSIKELESILEVQGSTFTSDMVVVNHDLLIKYSLENIQPRWFM
jgi:hypothetical protein